MKNQDRLVILFLIMTACLAAGLIKETIVSQNAPGIKIATSSTVSQADLSKIKSRIARAGLTPHEAQYWITLGENK